MHLIHIEISFDESDKKRIKMTEKQKQNHRVHGFTQRCNCNGRMQTHFFPYSHLVLLLRCQPVLFWFLRDIAMYRIVQPLYRSFHLCLRLSSLSLSASRSQQAHNRVFVAFTVHHIVCTRSCVSVLKRVENCSRFSWLAFKPWLTYSWNIADNWNAYAKFLDTQKAVIPLLHLFANLIRWSLSLFEFVSTIDDCGVSAMGLLAQWVQNPGYLFTKWTCAFFTNYFSTLLQ